MTPRKTEPVWPDEQTGSPPLEGIVEALEVFDAIGDASPLEIELRVSAFLGQLGAGAPHPGPGEPDHEELLNGIVEVCLHHLDRSPPRRVLDFLWVLDAFDLGWLAWPLRDRLSRAETPARPAWAMDVGQAEVTGAHVVGHETGDGYDVAISARHRSAASDHLIAVYVDRTIGGLATDLLVHPDAAEYLQLSEQAEGMAVTEIPLDVAQATIDEAIDATFAADVPGSVSSSFGALWSAVEHYLDKLPPGGVPLPEPAPRVTETAEVVVDRFLESLTGMAHRPDREALVEAVSFVADELGGDPVRWTAPVVQVLLSAWMPLAGLDDESVQRFPAAVRAFVPWAHREEGWGSRYLDDAVQVIDRFESGEPAAGATDQDRGGVEILEQALAEGVDLNDEAALDSFLDRYLDEGP